MITNVFDNGLRKVTNKLEELNKRAARHGMNVLGLRVVKTVQFVPVYRKGFGAQQNLHCIEITGCAPRIDGWRLIARVEFNSTIGNVVRIVPGIEDDGSFSTYRTIDSVCEHCNSKRNRNDVFVLEHTDGSRKVIGRNCLADFLRCEDAEHFARYAEFASMLSESADGEDGEDGEGGMGGGRCLPTMPLDKYLPTVAMMARRIGWVSRTASKDNPGLSATADNVFRYLFVSFSGKQLWIDREELYVTPDDIDLAANAIEWAKSIDDNGNEYRSIIKRIARANEVDFKGLDGYAASIIIAYRKAIDDLAERARTSKNKVYFGCAGKREKKVRVKCVGLHSFDGYYGTTTIVRFERTEGDDCAVLVWFASGSKEDEWTIGEEYTIDATIKEHKDDPKYGKQTVINRVSVK